MRAAEHTQLKDPTVGDRESPGRSVAGMLLLFALFAPAVLGVYPIGLALRGMGLGPPFWVATSWQLASVVTWSVIATALVPYLHQRAAANVAAGRTALAPGKDATVIPVMVGAAVAHAVLLAFASGVLMLGRGRPTFVPLAVDLFLLYAPVSAMTLLGLVAAAVVGAEYDGRSAERSVRRDLERQLDDARTQVIATLAELNEGDAPQVASPPTDYLERIAVTLGDRTTVVHTAEIDWIEARSYYARLHVGDRTYLVRQSMSALERGLDPRHFARIHRSTIVNLDRVTELRPRDRRSYFVVLRDGVKLIMSRRRRRLIDFLVS